jgi:hypothetical protein
LNQAKYNLGILRALKDPFLIAQELKDKEEKGENKSDEAHMEFYEMTQV